MKYLLALALFLTMSSSALAYEKAEEILWACTADGTESPEKAFEKIHCIGYVTGILDGIQLVFGVRPESKFFCPPTNGMSVDQQIRIVTKWLEDNPKELHKGARMSVLIAYAKTFPCK